VRPGIPTCAATWLRKGAKSPFGNELTAEDVKWSLDRGIKRSSIIRFFLFDSSNFRKENTVEVLDPSTVRIHFVTPTAFNQGVFTHLQFQIVDSKTVSRNATSKDEGGAWLQRNRSRSSRAALQSPSASPRANVKPCSTASSRHSPIRSTV
jgi:peptide/nickel transport system substrate-binding protein